MDQQREIVIKLQKEKKLTEEELHVKQRELDHLINHYISK